MARGRQPLPPEERLARKRKRDRDYKRKKYQNPEFREQRRTYMREYMRKRREEERRS